MQAELREIERALRRQVTSLGLGQRLANGWGDKDYPNQRLDAASLVYTQGAVDHRAYDEGALIRSSRGRFLAIPTENAPWKGTASKSAQAPSLSSGLDHSGSCLDRAGPQCLWWADCALRSAGKPESSEVSGVRQIGRGVGAKA